MTPAETLLGRLADWRPAGDGRHSLSVAMPEAGWAAQVSADRVDTVGGLLREFAMTRTGDAPAGRSLRQWADRLAASASGLLEPLAVIEVDGDRPEALLRSKSPARRGDDLLYYELRLTGLTGATLRRFQTTPSRGGRRDQVPFALTHEALAKLADDIAG